MVDKKSDKPVQPDADKLLEKKIDKMMNLKDSAPDRAEVAVPDGEISKVAASINQSLAQELDVSKMKEVKSAPELPMPQLTLPDPEPAKEPVKPVETAPDPPPKPEAELTETAKDPEPDINLDDTETNKAVDDIVSKEGDTVLAVEDAKRDQANKAVVSHTGWKDKFKGLFRSKKAWLIIIALLLVIFAVPFTRYTVLGLVIKKTVTITVVDGKTASPVSNVEVKLAGDSAKTNANGKAKLRAGLGNQDLLASKRYYDSLTTSYFVGFKAAESKPLKLVATGRLVPIKVTNKVTGQPVSGVQVQSEGTTAKTNSKGQAEIALPTKSATYTGKITSKGYNSSEITIKVTDKSDKANNFELVPTGQIYFLSNRSGKLDVVKSNLDGSARKVVLEGTGKEDPRTTSLLASRDWRYLVLNARRDSATASLYLIDTSNDKITQFETGDADLALVGWYEHNFVYSLTRNNVPFWQAGKQVIKSYDATRLQPNQLDQSQAEGDSNNYAYQEFLNFYILNGVVAYNTQWNGYSSGATAYDLASKTDSIRAVQPNGQNKKDYQNYSTTTTDYVQAQLYEPKGVYYAANSSGTKPTYYVFEDLAVKTANIDQNAFDKNYPTFLLSPTGKQTFWSELRDGKNTLFTGNDNAENSKQLASLSDYSSYGWHSDAYILISKNSSELYISSPAALKANRPPLKITDYYKPAQTYAGYGYGYGGL